MMKRALITLALAASTLLVLLAVGAWGQTPVTKKYHAGVSPSCWIYHDSGGIKGGGVNPNPLGGIDSAGQWSFPEPRITVVSDGEVGCKDAGRSFSCTDETDRNYLTDPNLLPQVVQYCLTANDRLGGANRAAHATVVFELLDELDELDDTYKEIKHAIVTDRNQYDYYKGCLIS